MNTLWGRENIMFGQISIYHVPTSVFATKKDKF